MVNKSQITFIIEQIVKISLNCSCFALIMASLNLIVVNIDRLAIGIFSL